MLLFFRFQARELSVAIKEFVYLRYVWLFREPELGGTYNFPSMQALVDDQN